MRFSLVVALLVTLLALVGTGCDGDDESATDGPPSATETTETETDGEETATTDDEAGDAANGEQVFAMAGCGGCHTLSAAGTNGSVGPNLDEMSPLYDKVVERVTNGQGAMPSFADDLSAQEIQDVAAFVSSSVES
ncbi:MAG: c-type cytochrome [Actinobacteria bacterium]|nr:c-type cytochrome [Actinomycetota bacterium]